MENNYAGLLRAGLAALLAVALGIAAPCLLNGEGPAWQHIVLLSMGMVDVLLLVTAFVLGIVAQMCIGRESESRGRAQERLLLMSDVFLIASVGVLAVLSVFTYVLTIIRIA